MERNVLDINGPTRGSKWRILCVMEVRATVTGTNQKRSRYFTHEVWSYEGEHQHYSEALRHADETLYAEAGLYAGLCAQNNQGYVYYVLQVEVEAEDRIEWLTTLHQTLKVMHRSVDLIKAANAATLIH